MEGVIYVMSNNCFMIKDHYKIGFTTDIEQRKKSYTTAFPVPCNWDFISEKISNIKTRERLIFQRLKEYRFNDSREYFICPLDKIKTTIEDVFKMTLKDMNLELNIKEWKIRYYEYYFNIIDDTNYYQEIKPIVKSYLEGINWVANYYFDTCTDWKWFYPYDHIPFLSDIFSFLKNENKFSFNKMKKRKNIEILNQLMIILPPQYSKLLPTSYKNLMNNDDSAIIDLFPVEVELDYLYKDMFWQCEPKLPIIDIGRILTETKELKISSNSNKRNQNLNNFIF